MSRGPFDPRRKQFARPHGPLGRLAGLLMARMNVAMAEAVAELLDVQPTDHVLEIGFGPGVLIERLARRAGQGLVAGVDPSPVMLDQARRRNRRAIRQGRVELQLGEVSNLPYPDGFFTAAGAVNSVQFWPRPEDDLREVRRVLRHGGRLVLGLRIRDPHRRFMRTVGFTEAEVREVEGLVRAAGFREVRVERRRLPREVADHVLGRV